MPSTTPAAPAPVPPDDFRAPIQMLPRGYWIGTASAVLVTASALVWALFGSVAIKVYGQGLLVAAGETVVAVEPERAGILREIRIKPGDTVEAGQILAVLELRDLEAELRTARLIHDQLNREFEKVSETAAQESARRHRSYDERRTVLADESGKLDASAMRLAKQVADGEALFAKGLFRAADLEAVRRQHDVTSIDAAKNRTAIVQAQADLFEFENQLAARVRSAEENRARQAERLRELTERLLSASELRAPRDATVIEIPFGPGEFVQPGQTIITLSVTDPKVNALDSELVTFLDVGQGLRALPGMAAHVIPSTVKKEEFGAIRAEVLAVRSRPASESEVNGLLRNVDLTRRFMGGGPPIISRLRLASAPDTSSGYAWWTGSGPPWQIRRYTICAVEIDVGRQPPITLVLPLLKKLLGV
jgi:NHLM bacteriocin system secretion protein